MQPLDTILRDPLPPKASLRHAVRLGAARFLVAPIRAIQSAEWLFEESFPSTSSAALLVHAGQTTQLMHFILKNNPRGYQCLRPQARLGWVMVFVLAAPKPPPLKAFVLRPCSRSYRAVGGSPRSEKRSLSLWRNDRFGLRAFALDFAPA